MSLQETVEALEVRAVLESLAARTAAAVLAGRCKDLRCATKAIVAAARRRDFSAFQQHNQVFHRAIVEASGNRVLLRVWDSLVFQIRTRFTMDFLTAADPVAIAREHEPIVEAVDRGDAPTAASLLESHSRGLVEYLRKEPGTPASTSNEGSNARRRTNQPRSGRAN